MKARIPAAILLACALGFAALALARTGGPQPFERGSWATLRAQHAGQPTVVHFWGLTCGPCLVEMPEWGKLLAERSDLRLVLVAADPVAQSPERVEARLSRDGLGHAESWIFADRFTERLFYEIDPTWQGELPRTVMITADGMTTAIAGVADLAQVRAWLDAQVPSRANPGGRK